MKRLVAAAVAAAVITTALPAVAQPGGQYGGYSGLYLQGLRVDSAKSQLANAGYTKARNINVGGRQYDLWANARARESCLGFTSYNGKVTEVRGFNDAECGLTGGGWGGFNPHSLNGLRVDDGKRALRNAGFSHERNVRIDGQQWDLWRSDRGRDRGCIGFTSYNGRITATREFRRGECDGDWNGGGWLRPEDLRGLSVDQAKRELSRSGFGHVRNIRYSGKQWDLWHDDRGRDGRCVGFTSYNGRVTDARNFSERDCY